jgi:hypothetical protein
MLILMHRTDNKDLVLNDAESDLAQSQQGIQHTKRQLKWFSSKAPSNDEQPGPPLVLEGNHSKYGQYKTFLVVKTSYERTRSSRFSSGPRGKNQENN